MRSFRRVAAELDQADNEKLLALMKRFEDVSISELVRWGIRILYAQQFPGGKADEERHNGVYPQPEPKRDRQQRAGGGSTRIH